MNVTIRMQHYDFYKMYAAHVIYNSHLYCQEHLLMFMNIMSLIFTIVVCCQVLSSHVHECHVPKFTIGNALYCQVNLPMFMNVMSLIFTIVIVCCQVHLHMLMNVMSPIFINHMQVSLVSAL